MPCWDQIVTWAGWNFITAVSTLAIALITLVTIIIAKRQLSLFSYSQVGQFLLTLHEKIDSETARKDREMIYKKYSPKIERPKEMHPDDFRVMEKISNNFDVVGVLVLENKHLRKRALQLWAIAFYRCWLCMEPYVAYQREKRGDENYLKSFEELYKFSKDFMGKTAESIKWY